MERGKNAGTGMNLKYQKLKFNDFKIAVSHELPFFSIRGLYHKEYSQKDLYVWKII